jgi:hypothetical protein
MNDIVITGATGVLERRVVRAALHASAPAPRPGG